MDEPAITTDLLLGGHSGEGSQMSCGLSVNGFARPAELMLKSGMRPGDLLILTKPPGSGVLFAADMRGKARGDWIDAALEQMMVSSQAAARCFKRLGASAAPTLPASDSPGTCSRWRAPLAARSRYG